jgi:hypothetical protein
MTLKNFASIADTKLYSEKHKNLKFNSLGRTDLLVSEVGFGGYRIDIRSPLNRDALKKALLSGINLIDTSSNYTDGNSELLIGEVLQELVNANMLSRESVVIVTKGGYLQGKNYALSLSRKEENYPFPELVEYEEGLEHCIHPEFIEDQIKRSLERLKLKTIDIYLLHNPEYYLKYAEKKGIDISTAREEYYRRIKKAFEYLEKEVQNGRIKHYGISSNTFTNDADTFDFTSLEKIISIAEEISKNNHFSVIEFPMNLLENNAATKTNQFGNEASHTYSFGKLTTQVSKTGQPGGTTLLDLAEKKNLGVLINRPLNAFYNNKVIRLAEPLVHNAPSIEAINQELENINNLEKSITEKLKLYGYTDISSSIIKNLFIFNELNHRWTESKDIFRWEAKLNKHFLPKFHYYKNYIKNNSLKNEELEMDLFSCTFKIGKLFSLISSYYNNEYLKFTDRIKKDLAVSVPELKTSKKLSHMAIHTLRSTKGVTTVLVGLDQVPYVSDAIEELKQPVNKDFDWNKINADQILNK